ncbi:FAD synthetase, chloroplastic-like isoform X2 [Phalaenopsis equestris]|uniref:FAD synthetase, chloroplastic-like isoform X2 n=1 Tax=Phalaenopsis equestris TaxID=78828 RepID=UPI0009E1BF18|nr:FAD synthetase, chloroplastic-like isoform X2 [Phalaenopsis equestris]
MERGGALLHLSCLRVPTSTPVYLLLGERSFPCWRGGFHNMYKALHKSQYAMNVLSSCEPQEVEMDGKEVAKSNFLIDCEIDQQCVVGGIVALGKFDALHLGHRELVIQASKAGIPFLLSFVGIAEVLGWETRPPIVAKCDRKRVLSSWAPYCSNIVPLEYHIDFAKVRHLTPRQFVERLSKELRVGGVVAGANYRFGYKASGDAKDLVRLCNEYGLSAYIVGSVMDKTQQCFQNGGSVASNSSDRGQVSSTRVRNALAARDMPYVAELLGRKHRLVLMLTKQICQFAKSTIIAPKSCMLNQPPGDGEFNNCTLLLDDVSVGLCRLVIDSHNIKIDMDCRIFSAIDVVQDRRCIAIEF